MNEELAKARLLWPKQVLLPSTGWIVSAALLLNGMRRLLTFHSNLYAHRNISLCFTKRWHIDQ